MLPVVAELAGLPAYDEVRRVWAEFPPAGPAHGSQLEERRLQAFMNNLAIALLHLDDAVRPCWIAAIAEIVDDESPGTRNRLQNLPRPLEDEMGRAHGDSCVGPRFGMRMSNSNRHQRLAGSALADDDR